MAEDALPARGLDPRIRWAQFMDEPRPWKVAFLHMYSQSGNISMSAQAAKIDRSTVKHAKESDPRFAQAMAEARLDAIDLIYGALFERALSHDTTAAIYLLKNMDPDNFNERRKLDVEVKGEITVDHTLNMEELKDVLRVLVATGQIDLQELLGTGESPQLEAGVIEGTARRE